MPFFYHTPPRTRVRVPAAAPDVQSISTEGNRMESTTPGLAPLDVRVKALIDSLSAYIEQYHGGAVRFISLQSGTLTVRLEGACSGCPLSENTLHGWVEGTVRQFFPEIEAILSEE
jgi:Fe-S cluster biogenesis protein NfuA